MVNTAPPDRFSEVGENVAWEVSELETVYRKTKQLSVSPPPKLLRVPAQLIPVAARVLTTNFTSASLPPLRVTAP